MRRKRQSAPHAHLGPRRSHGTRVSRPSPEPLVAVLVYALEAHLALNSPRRPRGGPLRPRQPPLTQPRQGCVAPGNPTRAGHRGLLGEWLDATLPPRTHALQTDCCFEAEPIAARLSLAGDRESGSSLAG